MKEIELSQGKIALVDDGDYDNLIGYSWFARRPPSSKTYYAYSSVKIGKRVKTLLMHRIILDAPRGVQVDHRDRNGLNNRRQNIRLCTPSENSCNVGLKENNTSGYKGVSWHKPTKKWGVKIRVCGKRIHLGHFTNKHRAAKIYNEAALKYHGKFACQNALPTAVYNWCKEKEDG